MTEEIAGQLVYIGQRQTKDPKKPTYAFMLLDKYRDDDEVFWFDLKRWKAASKPTAIGGIYNTVLKFTDGKFSGFKDGLGYAGYIADRDLRVAWAGIDATARRVKSEQHSKERAETALSADVVLAEDVARLQRAVNKCRSYNEAHAFTEAIQRELMKGWHKR